MRELPQTASACIWKFCCKDAVTGKDYGRGFLEKEARKMCVFSNSELSPAVWRRVLMPCGHLLCASCCMLKFVHIVLFMSGVGLWLVLQRTSLPGH